MHRMRWDDLQVVLSVAEHNTLSGAARELGLNHSTVLRRIETLERQLDLQLFERPPGDYRLKPEAQELLSSLRAIDRTIGRVERSLSAARRRIEGSFRITTTDSVADRLLPRHIETLRAANPGLQITLIVSNARVDMARPEAEITLRPAGALPEGLSGTRISDMAFGIFGSKAYLAGNPSHEVEAHRWLGVSPLLAKSPVGAWQEAHGVGLPVALADSFLSLARLAGQGMGLAMMPSFVGRTSPDLVELPILKERVANGFWAAAHPDLMALPHIAGLVDFFVDALRSDRHLLE